MKQSNPELKLTRRHFMGLSAASAIVASSGVTGCFFRDNGEWTETTQVQGAFTHGVASGDPLSDRVVLWTRYQPLVAQNVQIFWQVALDAQFVSVINDGKATIGPDQNYILKVDVSGLSPGKQYFYRFRVGNIYSVTGATRTLPTGAVDQVKMAVVSCANYPAGYFHAYAEAAKRTDLDVVVHLGDYIYEYGRYKKDDKGQLVPEYASEFALFLGRESLPPNEIVTLADYRMRYSQYRSDADLQALHQKYPFICIWDDHEIADNAWRDGAYNHDETLDGVYAKRREAALQAYVEWLPIRPVLVNQELTLHRGFSFGDLVQLSMLDTRGEGRDKQISAAEQFNKLETAQDIQQYLTAVKDPNRSMIGTTQRTWLTQEFKQPARWHVLGQQVIMGRLYLPAALVTEKLTFAEYAEYSKLIQLSQRIKANDPTLTLAEKQEFATNQYKLTPEVLALMSLPNVPFNTDAWDGYDAERQWVYQEALNNNVNLVVLAGDSHNSWANDLVFEQTATDRKAVGVEFAGTSVSSPGMEYEKNFQSANDALQTEAAFLQLIETLKYMNASDRGLMIITFTREKVTCDWVYVRDVRRKVYEIFSERAKTLSVSYNNKRMDA